MRRLIYLPAFLGIFVLVLSVAFSAYMVSRPRPTTTFQAGAAIASSSVSLFPAKASLFAASNKDGFPIGVILESGDEVVTGSDFVISFDPKVTTVTSLVKGTLFDNYPVLQVDNAMGKVTISASNTAARTVNGILASFRLQPRGKGEIRLDFAESSGVKTAIGGSYTAL